MDIASNFFFAPKMKTTGIIGICLFTLACSNSSQKTQSTTDVVRTDIYTDSIPLSYDELNQQFKDTNVIVSASQADLIYKEIAGKLGNKTQDYSRLTIEDLLPAYERLGKLSQIYVDSSATYLDVFETNLNLLDKQYEKVDQAEAIEINLKLKISETKSDIHQSLSKLRLKKIQ